VKTNEKTNDKTTVPFNTYKIKLNEVPEEGREYVFNQNTAELNADLADLIGSSPFSATVYIRPLNTKDFELRGQVQASTNEDCSLCGESFKLPAKIQMSEILIPSTHRSSEKNDKTGKQSKPNHISDLANDGTGVTEYQGEEFEIGQCIRQAIALSVPFNPKPPVNEKGDCSVCLMSQMTEPFSYDENMGNVEKKNPFAVLKGVKLN